MANGLICPSCDSTKIITERVVSTIDYRYGDRNLEISARVPVHTCEACGEKFTDDEAETIQHAAICAALGRLNPADITALRNHYGLSKRDFAELTGIGEASLHRWESGEHIQNVSIDRLLRLLGNPENIAALSEISGVKVKSLASVRRASSQMSNDSSPRVIVAAGNGKKSFPNVENIESAKSRSQRFNLVRPVAQAGVG